jgi:hypothetical protein
MEANCSLQSELRSGLGDLLAIAGLLRSVPTIVARV